MRVIYIWIRGTLDWQDEEAFWAQVPPGLKPRVELWNSTFNMPFHIFRHRVRQIAALNHSRVEGDVAWAEWDEIPSGARVVPVDDDDWFAPDVGQVLEREWGSFSGVFWPATSLGIPLGLGHWVYTVRRAVLGFTPPFRTCDTNNYGLVKADGTKPLLETNRFATEWFDGPGREHVKQVGQRLSVVNRTLGSRSALLPRRRPGELTRFRLLRRLRRYRWLYRRRRLHGMPAWSRPYRAMMAELIDELEPRA